MLIAKLSNKAFLSDKIYWILTLSSFLLILLFGNIGVIDNLKTQLFFAILASFAFYCLNVVIFQSRKCILGSFLLVTLFCIFINEIYSIGFIKNNGILVFIFTIALLISTLKIYGSPVFPNSLDDKEYGFFRFHLKNYVYTGTVVLLIVLFIGFGVRHIGQFMSVDEPKWLQDRIPQLYSAIENKAWSQTYINDKPGLLTSYLAGIANLYFNVENYDIINHSAKYKENNITTYLTFWRLPIVLFNGIILFFISYFLARLFDKEFALIVLVGIALNPLLIGMSQIVNPDSTLWSLSMLSFIFFALYLKTYKIKYVIYSGVVLGGAFLSKFSAAYLLIMFPIGILIEYFVYKEKKPYQILTQFNHFLILMFVSMITFFVFFPATWTDIEKLFDGTINLGLLSSGMPVAILSVLLLLFDLILLDAKIIKFIKKYKVFYLFGMLFGLSVLALVVFIFINNLVYNQEFFNFGQFWGEEYIRRGEGQFKQILLSNFTIGMLIIPIFLLISFIIFSFNMIYFRWNNLWASSISIFTYFYIVVFLGITGISGFMANTHYQMLIIPFYSILMAFLLRYGIKNNFTRKIFILFISVYSILTLLSSPFYYQFTNVANITDIQVTNAWGFGGYEAAEYLNKTKDVKSTVVWTDKEGFRRFYKGKTLWRGGANPFLEKNNVDYLVLTSAGKDIFQRSLKKWKRGDRYLYAYVAANTPILEYYKREGEYRKCLRGNLNNCIWIVEMKEKYLYQRK